MWLFKGPTKLYNIIKSIFGELEKFGFGPEFQDDVNLSEDGDHFGGLDPLKRDQEISFEYRFLSGSDR